MQEFGSNLLFLTSRRRSIERLLWELVKRGEMTHTLDRTPTELMLGEGDRTPWKLSCGECEITHMFELTPAGWASNRNNEKRCGSTERHPGNGAHGGYEHPFERIFDESTLAGQGDSNGK